MKPDPYELVRAWGLPRATSARRPDAGTNNTVWVTTVGRDRYILRIHENARPDQIHAEHRLLAALAELPFRVPVPIRTPDGGTTVATSAGPASLSAYLQGTAPTPDHLELAGRALGDLDVALARLPAELAPIDWRRPLDAIHPGVPDLTDLAHELERTFPGHPGIGWLAESAAPAQEAYRRYCDTLPVQIVHGDFALSNLLLDGGRVSAVLDFEIAGLDLRANDLVAGLHQCTETLDQAAAFLRGYRSRVTLLPEELRAIPELLRLRALGSLVWRSGRWRRGLAGGDEVRHRLDGGIHLETWLADHATHLAAALAT